MLGIIDSIRTEKMGEEAVSGAIRYVSGIRKIMLQTLDSRSDEAVFSELYGLGPDFSERHLEALASVTSEDILRVADKYLDPAILSISVVGPKAAVDEAKKIAGAD